MQNIFHVIQDDTDTLHILPQADLEMDMLPDVVFSGSHSQCQDYVELHS